MLAGFNGLGEGDSLCCTHSCPHPHHLTPDWENFLVWNQRGWEPVLWDLVAQPVAGGWWPYRVASCS